MDSLGSTPHLPPDARRRHRPPSKGAVLEPNGIHLLSLSLSLSLHFTSLHFTSLRRGRVHSREPAPRRPLPQLAGGRGFGVSVGRGWLPLYVTTGGVCLARNLPEL